MKYKKYKLMIKYKPLMILALVVPLQTINPPRPHSCPWSLSVVLNRQHQRQSLFCMKSAPGMPILFGTVLTTDNWNFQLFSDHPECCCCCFHCHCYWYHLFCYVHTQTRFVLTIVLSDLNWILYKDCHYHTKHMECQSSHQ